MGLLKHWFAVLAAGAIAVAGIDRMSGPGGAWAAQDTFAVIGSGGITGVYYPVGASICRLVNDGRKEHGVHCSVEATAGSVSNLQDLHKGKYQFALAQSDTQYNAYRGLGPFHDDGPYKEIRSLFSLHAEPMTLVVRTDSNIHSFGDLQGKRVNLGPPGSGARATADAMLAALGWRADKDFSKMTELSTSEQSQALCDDAVDAIFFSVGHPSSTIKEATTACDTTIVPITGPGVDKLISSNPYYSRAVVPGGLYPNTPTDVSTFGVRATFVTSVDTPEQVVYQLVKSVFTHLDDFSKMHPALAGLKAEDMVSASLSAPLHPGAARYFREAGLMK